MTVDSWIASGESDSTTQLMLSNPNENLSLALMCGMQKHLRINSTPRARIKVLLAL
jgi:hypothetical protein